MDIDVSFNEKLDRITCATLLIETIKYLLFHRFQIPLPFDQFQAEDERERIMETEETSPKTRARRPVPSTVKKKRQLIADIEELLRNIYHLFLQADILDVVLLFGATVVNPKEMYSVRFENIGKVTEADRLKALTLTGKENGPVSRTKFVDKCCRKLAKTLFTDSNLNDCGELKCTSMHCFILASRHANIVWFRPKATFKIPKKGKFFAINVSECMGGEKDVEEQLEHDGNEETLWFQAPTVVKGYKEAYKETTESSIWGKQV